MLLSLEVSKEYEAKKMGNQNKKIIIQVAIRLESVKMRTISTEKNNNGKKVQQKQQKRKLGK